MRSHSTLLYTILALLCLACFHSNNAYAETTRSVAVYSTVDASKLNLGPSLQNFLNRLYEETGAFKPAQVQDRLAGYSEGELNSAFQKHSAEVISFAYIEQQRLSIFLFDSLKKGQFIYSSHALAINSQNKIADAMIETQARRTFNTIMEEYKQGRYQNIQAPVQQRQTGPEISKEEKARNLFKEFAAIQDSPIYIGMNLGMARFAAGDSSASTVNVGGFAGARLSEDFRAEIGASAFSYLLLQADLKYRVPLSRHYISLFAEGCIGQVAALLTQNRGFNSADVQTGQFLFGPGLSFEVPLLGAQIRGEIRAYFGQTNILMGTYGISYSL